MSDEIDKSIIKTQEALSEFVKRPPLTEKLLKKPPFRFLHDIITTIIRGTGFFDGLFSEDELVSENIKDRDKKIDFLQKIIKVINIVMRENLSVKPSKIISGQEPEKTNELLQKIGIALQNNLSSIEAVEAVKKENSKSNPPENSKKTKKTLVDKPISTNVKKEGKIKKNENHAKASTNSKTQDRVGSKEETIKKKKNLTIDVKRSKAKLPNNEKTLDSKDEVLPNVEKEENINKFTNNQSLDLKSPIRIDENINTETIKNNLDDNQLNSNVTTIDQNMPTELNIENSTESLNENEEKLPQKIEKVNLIHDVLNINVDNNNIDEPKKAPKGEKEEKTNKLIKSIPAIPTSNIIIPISNVEFHENAEENTSNKADAKNNNRNRPIKSAITRPSSARPSAPQFKNNNVDLLITSNLAPKEKINIIMEDYNATKEEDDSDIVMELAPLDSIQEKTFVGNENNINEHGHLVQQILETQKALTKDKKHLNETLEVEKVEWKTKIEQEASLKEIDTIKTNLQMLSRISNPIGKLMEYIQEDIENMRQEFSSWKKSYNSAMEIYNNEKSITDRLLKPLELQLKKLEVNITEHKESITDIKLSICGNSKKITKLIYGDNIKMN